MHRTALAFTRSTLFRSTKLRTVSHAASRFHSSALQRKSDDAAESDLTHPALLKDPPTSNPSSATDPWTLKPPPLPETPLPTNEQGQVVQSMEELLASPHPEGRDNEDAETLRKRLLYESRKRGILEMDLILGTFAKTRLEGMSERELREYDRLLTLPDWSIYYYVTRKAPAPEPWKSSWVLQELMGHSENKGRTVRRMPDLENPER